VEVYRTRETVYSPLLVTGFLAASGPNAHNFAHMGPFSAYLEVRGVQSELCWKWLVLMGNACGSIQNSRNSVFSTTSGCFCGCFGAECAQFRPCRAIFGLFGTRRELMEFGHKTHFHTPMRCLDPIFWHTRALTCCQIGPYGSESPPFSGTHLQNQ